MLAGKALDLGHERRLGRPRRAPERALERRPQVRQRLLGLDRAALPRFGGQVALAVQRHRDPEQALDHALVDLAGQVDPMLELPRPLPPGWRLCALPKPAPRPCRASTAGAARRHRAAALTAAGRPRSRPRRDRLPPSARTPAGPARETGSMYSVGNWPVISPAISITRSSRRDWAAIGADSTVTCASANCSRFKPYVPAARTRRRRVVVAEDQRPAHVRRAGTPPRTAGRRTARPMRPGRPRTATAPRRTARARPHLLATSRSWS